MTNTNSASRLHDAVAAVCPIDGVSVGKDSDTSTVTIQFSAGVTADQQAAAQAVVAAFDWTDFAGAQQAKLADIDARSDVLRAAGWTYANKAFDLSAAAIPNWLGLMIGAALLSYPFTILAVDNTLYNLTGVPDVQAWYAAGQTRLAQILQQGAALKVAVQAAKTQADLDAVIDARA